MSTVPGVMEVEDIVPDLPPDVHGDDHPEYMTNGHRKGRALVSVLRPEQMSAIHPQASLHQLPVGSTVPCPDCQQPAKVINTVETLGPKECYVYCDTGHKVFVLPESFSA